MKRKARAASIATIQVGERLSIITRDFILVCKVTNVRQRTTDTPTTTAPETGAVIEVTRDENYERNGT